MTTQSCFMFNTEGKCYKKQLIDPTPHLHPPAKIPWSKSSVLNWRSVPAVQSPPLIWAHSSSLQLSLGLWVRQCVWNLQTQSRICLCKSMWRWKEEARCLVTYPYPPHPSTEHEAIWLPARGHDHALRHEAFLQRVSINKTSHLCSWSAATKHS